MRRTILRIAFGIVLLCLLSTAAFAQGRGRGRGLQRKSDVFVNGHDARDGRWDGRGPNQNWKCGVFVNCHDARNGRLDGRGRRVSRNRFANNVLVPRGASVGYRNRYNMSDYWNRRHVMNRTTYLNNRGRYRSRSWRNR